LRRGSRPRVGIGRQPGRARGQPRSAAGRGGRTRGWTAPPPIAPPSQGAVRMNPLAALAIAALPAFIASVVEFVEAFTIVLAVGTTRGWRAPMWGTAAAAVTLAIIVLVFGTPLITYHDQVSSYFHLVVGVLLLLFGMRWLRKAILRFAGIIALH